ncbi:MAG TPA: type II secretion system major pseudopilin GspG [Planctomycetota bacterium]|nr:type II secretion system major pseudopilin GspG [Planctomycetota bacterium]
MTRALPGRLCRRPSGAGGFTLIELLLVVVIIGILAAIVVPRLAGRSEDARIAKAQGDITSFKTALGAYEVDNGKYPTSDQGLRALVQKPGGSPEPKNWKGPYLENLTDIPKDPWDHEYQYRCPGTKNANGYDLFSWGPDGVEGTQDDIWQ